MPKQYIFWILMLLWALFSYWPTSGQPIQYKTAGRDLLLFVLLGLLGWQVFGQAVK